MSVLLIKIIVRIIRFVKIHLDHSFVLHVSIVEPVILKWTVVLLLLLMSTELYNEFVLLVVDECDQNTDDCNQICTDTQGSYVCSCHAGYELNGKYTCIG